MQNQHAIRRELLINILATVISYDADDPGMHARMYTRKEGEKNGRERERRGEMGGGRGR